MLNSFFKAVRPLLEAGKEIKRYNLVPDLFRGEGKYMYTLHAAVVRTPHCSTLMHFVVYLNKDNSPYLSGYIGSCTNRYIFNEPQGELNENDIKLFDALKELQKELFIEADNIRQFVSSIG